MLIAFTTPEIRELCINETRAIEQLGRRASDVLKNRLKDIQAADFISDLVAGQPRKVILDGQAHYLLDLVDGLVLTLACNHLSPRRDADGDIDWTRVRRVKVVSVGQA